MDRAGGGKGRIGEEPSRFRKLVHSLEMVRGGQFTVQSCPLEQECRQMQEVPRENDREEFRVLAALRNSRLERPYFRGRTPLAVACPGVPGRPMCACLLAIGGGPRMNRPQAGPGWPTDQEERAPAYRPGLPRPAGASAGSVPCAPRAIALSSTGSRHED